MATIRIQNIYFRLLYIVLSCSKELLYRAGLWGPRICTSYTFLPLPYLKYYLCEENVLHQKDNLNPDLMTKLIWIEAVRNDILILKAHNLQKF